jgi:hypothetical protein
MSGRRTRPASRAPDDQRRRPGPSRPSRQSRPAHPGPATHAEQHPPRRRFHDHHRPPTAPIRPVTPLTVLTLTATAIAASIVPVLFGIAFIASALARRPLMVTLTRRWPRLAGGPLDQESPQVKVALSRPTTMWGVVLLVIGMLQGIGALAAGLSITNPASVAIRTLAALTVLAVLWISTTAYLRRRRLPA